MNYFVHESAYVDEGCSVGAGTKIWHFSHIMSNCTIGENCNIGQNVVISPEVVLGKNVKVQNNVSIYTGVICEDDVFWDLLWYSPMSSTQERGEPQKSICEDGSEKGVSIGANATIVCGHDIGEYAFIGAGACGHKNVPAYALVVGNPARQTGWIGEYGHKLVFDKEGIAICSESNQKYKMENNKVIRIS